MPKGCYIGIRGAERWVKGPAPRTPFQAAGWGGSTLRRDGRINIRRLRTTHMEYELDWPTVTFDEARYIEEMYYGTHGDGLIHWIDPTVRNLAPAHWSQPEIGCTDGPLLYGGERPARVTTAANSNGYPAYSAVYAAQAGGKISKLYIPIPVGYQAFIGVHGVANSIGITVAQPVRNRTAVGSPSIVPTTAVTSTTRYSTVIPGAPSRTGVEIYLAPGSVIDGNTLPDSGTIASIYVEVLPAGKTPSGTSFILGGGSTGCEMPEPPTKAPISAPREKTSISVKLVETD